VLRALDREAADGKPPPLLVTTARRLAEIESENSLSKPVWGLAKDLIARESGARSMALLQWRARQQHKRDEAEEVLAHYDALRDEIAKLPPKDRLALRLDLASVARDEGPQADQAQELKWEFARDWVQTPGVMELVPEQRLSTLVSTAQQSRRIPPGLPNPRLELLVPAMQAEARRFAEDKEMLAQHRLIYVATLSLHAAWHANRLAAHTPEGVRWKEWLVQHAAWTETALPQAARDWVAGVAVHRDAALKGRATEPDCPGASLLNCKWAYEPAPLAVTGFSR
jgi:hypothetical protein